VVLPLDVRLRGCLVCSSGLGDPLGWLVRPNDDDAIGLHSTSLEVRLRNPLSTPNPCPDESPKSLQLGGVDALCCKMFGVLSCIVPPLWCCVVMAMCGSAAMVCCGVVLL
jgi:hypothetical protein